MLKVNQLIGFGAYRQAAPAATFLLDTLGTAAVRAYSVRKLRAAYAGSAIRVRRSNDNAEADIGFDGSGNLDTAALATHVSSNSGYVVTWYDQSGNADNATQATAGNQPIIVSTGTLETNNSLPVVLFGSGTVRKLIAPAGASLQEGAFVASTTAAGPTWATYSGLIGRESSSGLVTSSAGTGDWETGGTGDFTSFNVNNTGTKNSVFGDVLFQMRGLRAAGALTATEIRIGGHPFDEVTRRWSGDIAEVIFWGSTLSAGDRTLVYNDQKAYWGTP